MVRGGLVGHSCGCVCSECVRERDLMVDWQFGLIGLRKEELEGERRK